MANNRPTNTVVESRGSGLVIVLGIAIVAILAILAYMFILNDNRETNAVTGAAQSVGDAADKVGGAAKDATK